MPMKTKKQKVKKNIKLSELSGLRLFRRFVLFAESIKHRKSGLYNENYHPKNTQPSTLKSFSGYLIYNSTFHIESIAAAALCFSLIDTIEKKRLAYVIFLIALIVFNLYCLLLQSYTYLKIKNHLKRVISKREKYVGECKEKLCAVLENRNSEEILKELELIEKIKECTAEGGDCIITSEDAPILERISKNIPFSSKNGIKHNNHTSPGTSKEYSFKLPEKMPIITKIKKRASRLQKIFGVKKENNLLFEYTVVTENETSEKAFLKVFGNSRDGIETALEILFKAYSEVARRKSI